MIRSRRYRRKRENTFSYYIYCPLHKHKKDIRVCWAKCRKSKLGKKRNEKLKTTCKLFFEKIKDMRILTNGKRKK